MARKYQYPEVFTLPVGAKTVRIYCNDRGWPNVSTFYKYFRTAKLPDVTLVIFQGFNYIVPVKSLTTN